MTGAAIDRVYRDRVAEGGADRQMKVADAGHDGALGWCLAVYGEGVTGAGHSLNVLERRPEGRWLIRQCSLNEDA